MCHILLPDDSSTCLTEVYTLNSFWCAIHLSLTSNTSLLICQIPYTPLWWSMHPPEVSYISPFNNPWTSHNTRYILLLMNHVLVTLWCRTTLDAAYTHSWRVIKAEHLPEEPHAICDVLSISQDVSPSSSDVPDILTDVPYTTCVKHNKPSAWCMIPFLKV